jgi:hypothetical protein
LFAFELRWARDVLSAFAPVHGRGLCASAHEVDYGAVLVRMLGEVTPLAAVGLRLSIWLAALAPLWLWGKFTTISDLAAERRANLLGALLTHRAFAVRELALLLKLCAAIALLGSPAVRMRSGYDDAAATQPSSGVRIRIPRTDHGHRGLRVWPSQDGTPSEVEIAREREAS